MEKNWIYLLKINVKFKLAAYIWKFYYQSRISGNIKYENYESTVLMNGALYRLVKNVMDGCFCLDKTLLVADT